METNDYNIVYGRYSVSYIADSPESDMTIEDRLEKARKDAMDAYSLAHKQAYASIWEHRRYEIASAAMQGFIGCKYAWDARYTAKMAVKYADALIEELRKPRNENEQ